MKSTFIKGITGATFLTAVLSFTSFAATINGVNFTAYMESDDITENVVDPAFMVTQSADTGTYVLSDYQTISTSDSFRSLRTYELTFTAIGENLFNQDSSSITVTGNGVESISSRRVSDEGETLTVRVRAYPHAKLEQTECGAIPVAGSGDKTIQLTKADGVSTVEYYLIYTDYNGDSHTVHKTTTGSSISVTSYIREYTRDDGDGQNMEITGFYCRSRAANTQNPYIVPSDWSGEGEEPDASDFTNYDSWSQFLGSSTGSPATSTQTNEGTATSESSGGWVQSGDDWFYRNANGTLATGWLQDGGCWYYLEASTGRMLTGWITDSDGHRYYLNPNAGGPKGSMITGWIQDADGNWYYFSPYSGAPLGSEQTGWIQDGGLWYYCSASAGGKMVTGWFTDTDGQKYYLNPNVGGPRGSMLTGWQLIDGKWYFFRQSTATGQGSQGACIVNRTVSINGVAYTFDENGAWIG